MPWLDCPNLETVDHGEGNYAGVLVVQEGGYEWDTGAGPFYAIAEQTCDCQFTDEQLDALFAKAYDQDYDDCG